MVTYDISAILHATPFLVQEEYILNSIFGGIFIGMGIMRATNKYMENKKRHKNKTIDSLVEDIPIETINE